MQGQFQPFLKGGVPTQDKGDNPTNVPYLKALNFNPQNSTKHSLSSRNS